MSLMGARMMIFMIVIHILLHFRVVMLYQSFFLQWDHTVNMAIPKETLAQDPKHVGLQLNLLCIGCRVAVYILLVHTVLRVDCLGMYLVGIFK